MSSAKTRSIDESHITSDLTSFTMYYKVKGDGRCKFKFGKILDSTINNDSVTYDCQEIQLDQRVKNTILHRKLLRESHEIEIIPYSEFDECLTTLLSEIKTNIINNMV